MEKPWRVLALNPKSQIEFEQFYLSKSYEVWQQSWRPVYRSKKLLPDKKLYADEFMAQDRIVSIFNKDTCIGLLFFKEIDLSTHFARDLLYFKAWAGKPLKKLRQMGSRAVICGNLCLAKKYRGGTKFGTPFREMLVALAPLYRAAVGADFVCSNTRVYRGVNKLCHQFGAETIEKEIVFNGEPSELVAFTAEGSKDNTYPFFIEYLWNNRIETFNDFHNYYRLKTI